MSVAAAPPPLAQSEDFARFTGRALTEEERTRVDWLLAAAGDAIRRQLEQVITLVADDRELHDGTGTHLLMLDQLPVVAVTEVRVAGAVLGAGELIVDHRTGRLWAGSGGGYYRWPRGRQNIEVIYTHGQDPVPADVVAVVCAMADRAWSAPGGGMIRSEQIGTYRYDLAAGAVGLGAVGLTEAEAGVLDRLRVRRYARP